MTKDDLTEQLRRALNTGDDARATAYLILEWLVERAGDYPNACGHLAAEWADTVMEGL